MKQQDPQDLKLILLEVLTNKNLRALIRYYLACSLSRRRTLHHLARTLHVR